MFNRLSLQAKLVSICAALAMLVLVAGGISYWALRDVSQKYHTVSNQVLPSIQYLGEMFAHFRGVRISVRTLGLEGINDTQTERAIRETEEAVRAYEEKDQLYRSAKFLPGEREHYDAINLSWKTFRPVVFELIALAKKGDAPSKAKIRSIFFKDCPEEAARYQDAMDKMMEFQRKARGEWVAKAESAAHFSNLLLVSLTLASFGVALLIGFIYSRNLSGLIRGIAEQLTKGADEVASAASEISATSEQLSSSVTQQAASLQQTSSSVEEMNAMVNKNAENASKSQLVAGEAETAATDGKQVVEQMIQAVEEINQSNAQIMSQIEDSNSQIAEIVKVIAEIGNKTKVINDIVFQTKLLSFNASVEAARAGEHGKGFAVVAEEVGNLAQMSGNAAKEISAMLEGSIQKVESIVEQTRTRVEGLVQSGRSKVETGVSVAKRCGEVLEDLVRNVSTVSAMVGEITSASQEQARGVQEITRAMTQLDQLTQQNSAASQQSAAASEQLAAQAERLRASVLILLQEVNGGEQKQAQPGTAPAPAVRESKIVHLPVGKSKVPSSSDPRFGT